MIEPLSECTNANGRLSVAWRQISPITPPCRIAATRTFAPAAATIASTPARTRSASDSIVSAPGITSQRSSATACSATGSPSAMRMRNSPPSHSPSETSRSSGTTVGSSPVRSASGAQVWWVRCSVVTNSALRPWPARCSATAAACASPSGASGGSPWPSSSGNGWPGSAGADAPWRTSITSVAPSGSANWRWW